MATKMMTIYSEEIDGAAIISGGAAFSNLTAADNSLEAQVQQALKYEEEGLIDPLENLIDKPIFIFHGTLDEIVKEVDVDVNFDFFGHQGANLHYNRTMPYCHNFPNNLPVTKFNPKKDCGIDYHPCSGAQACGFANCGEDIVDQYFTHILPFYDDTIKNYKNYGEFLQFN